MIPLCLCMRIKHVNRNNVEAKLKSYLILGASGLLGAKLMNFFPQSHGTYFRNESNASENMTFLDTTDRDSFRYLLGKIKPDVVINCTGMTNVDLCEQFPERCWKLNCWQPLIIAQECGAESIKYVYVSTDHFLNLSGAKLKEHDILAATNQYGFSKLNAEKFILLANKDSIVVRSNFFHFNLDAPRTFLDSLVKNIQNQKISYSFSDVVFTPISTFLLAAYMEKLLDINFSGVINISGSEILSKFEFHNAVLNKIDALTGFHLPALVDSIKLNASRPSYMALDNSLLKNLLGIKVPSIYDMIELELQKSK